MLATAPLHSIVFACTSGSFIGGKGYDVRIVDEMRKVSRGIPVTTTATACVKGLTAVGARRVVLVAPYTEAVTGRAVDYFSQHGFEVVAWHAMGLDDDVVIGEVPPEHLFDVVRRYDRPDADAVFISCTNLRTIAVLDELECLIGKPVVSANQASFWDGLRLAGVSDAVPSYGRLLTL